MGQILCYFINRKYIRRNDEADGNRFSFFFVGKEFARP